MQGLAGGVASHALSALAQTTPSQLPQTAAPRQVFGNGPVKIALVLEALGGPFGRAAAPVLAGVRAALGRDGQDVTLEFVQLTESADELDEVLADLGRRGFAWAIGPLTRNGVNALTDRAELPLPVLALNQPDAERRLPSNLVIFGLPIEAECRQVARAAFDEVSVQIPTRRPLRAMIVSNGTPLARRSATAFIDAWRELGGAMVSPIETDTRNASELRAQFSERAPDQQPDTIFLSVNPDAVRAVLATAPREVSVYGTSQLNSVIVGMPTGAAAGASELDGLRVLEMPWQIQQDHPAVMAYPKAVNLVHLELQRLYALGIDAFRVTRELIPRPQRFEIDGVTGKLRFEASAPRIDRNSVLAEFRNGVLVPLENR